MRISKLNISGFRGIRGTAEIPFGSGFTVISGPNGSGKSTICDAIEYLLTQRLTRFSADETESGERPDDYIWWRGHGVPAARAIEAEFVEDSGRLITINADPIGPKGLDISLFCDTRIAPKDSLRRLCITSIFRDELITNFSTDLSETGRAEFVYESIGSIGVPDIDRRSAIVKQELDRLIAQERSAYESARARVAGLMAMISELRAAAAFAEGRSIDDAARSLASVLEIEVGDVTALLGRARATLTKLRERLSGLERLQIALSNSTGQIAETEALQRDSDLLNSQLVELGASLEASTAQRTFIADAIALERQVAPLDLSLAQLSEHGRRLGLRDGKCPLCGSLISSAAYQIHLAEIQQEIGSHNSAIIELTGQEADADNQCSVLRSRFEAARAQHSRLLSDLEALRKSTERIAREALELDVPLKMEPIAAAIGDLRERSRQLDTRIRLLESFEALGKVTELEGQRMIGQRTAEEATQRLLVLEAARRSAEAAAAEAKKLSTELLEDRLAQLEPLLVELYVRFKPHVDYSEIKYKMRGQIRRFLRLEVGEDINPRFVFSSGQRRALGLAFLLAVHLSRPWCKLKTLVLDDPVQHIDDYRALHLVEVLSSIRQLGHQVVCTIEDSALADLLCRRLRSSSFDDGIRVTLNYTAGSGVKVQNVRQLVPLPETVLLSA